MTYIYLQNAIQILVLFMDVCMYDGNVNLSSPCIHVTQEECQNLFEINVIEICLYIFNASV